MIVRHSLPTGAFVKIDRNVFSLPNITDGAKVLYGYLCGLQNGSNKTDVYIQKVLKISRASLARRKKELTDANLILVDQIQPRVYVIYIGYTSCTASAVKYQWKDNDEDY